MSRALIGNEGIVIEANDFNITGTTHLATRAIAFPEAGAGNKHRKGERGRSSERRGSVAGTRDEAFVVKVKRRLDRATERVLRGLGLYMQMEEMPLGLVVDVWA